MSHLPHNTACLVDFEGIGIPVLYQRSRSRKLIIHLHGVIDQRKRPYPFFQPALPVGQSAHQIAIADPSFALSVDLETTWYIGSQNGMLQQILPRFFIQLAESLGVDRVIFLGGSAGGFAALYYSWHFAGSLAIAASPQMNVASFARNGMPRYGGIFETFRRICWPQTRDLDDLAEQVTLDLASLYHRDVPNYAVILNSVADRHHVFDHTAPFAANIPAQFHERVLFHSDYYGIPGHSGSVPYKNCRSWVEAGLEADNLRMETLVNTRYARLAATASPPVPQHGASRTSDIRISNAIRDWYIASQDLNP